MWLEIAAGEPRDLVADVILSGVEGKLASDLPQLSLARLEGRVGWHDDPSRREVYARQLAFAAPGEARFDPTDFQLTMHYDAGRPIDGNASFSRIELAPLRQLGPYLPLPTRWRDDLARFAPRGTLDAVALHWTGDIAAPSAFDASANFAGLGFAQEGAAPGVTGLSGSIAATDHDGAIKLDSHALAVHWPHLFAQTLALDTATGTTALAQIRRRLCGPDRPAGARQRGCGGRGQRRIPNARRGAGRGRRNGAVFAPRCDAAASLCASRRRGRRARVDTHQPARRQLERCAPEGLGQSRRFSVRGWQKGPVHGDRQGTGSDPRLRNALAAAHRPRRRGQGRWSAHQRRRPQRPRFQCRDQPDQGRDRRYADRASGVAHRGRGSRAGRGFPALHRREPGRRVARSYDPRRRSERRRQARAQAGTADRQPRRRPDRRRIHVFRQSTQVRRRHSRSRASSTASSRLRGAKSTARR